MLITTTVTTVPVCMRGISWLYSSCWRRWSVSSRSRTPPSPWQGWSRRTATSNHGTEQPRRSSLQPCSSGEELCQGARVAFSEFGEVLDHWFHRLVFHESLVSSANHFLALLCRLRWFSFSSRQYSWQRSSARIPFRMTTPKASMLSSFEMERSFYS